MAPKSRERILHKVKLVIAVVHDRDRGKISESLLRNGFKFTKIGSTGGFLREGNITLLIGADDKDVERVLGLINEASKSRKQYVNVLPPDAGPVGTFIPSPVEVEVGGAIAWVVDVERFERF
ncbi:cyclic-di-AMP receptor [Armatimonas rosea]|jgi:uncharacterized protein YaaQ|uniref:cyclic-di-AMP receptor n=1 Tax=Armatimonas rosea TaxID=685828 RepID=UPI0031B5C113